MQLLMCGVRMAEQYQSLVQCADDLTQLIQHNVVSVSSKLFAKGLVAKDVHDSVLSVDGASNQSKAAKLLSCVLDKIKESADQCQNFIDVLGEDSYFDNIVLKITKVHGKHYNKITSCGCTKVQELPQLRVCVRNLQPCDNGLFTAGANEH